MFSSTVMHHMRVTQDLNSFGEIIAHAQLLRNLSVSCRVNHYFLQLFLCGTHGLYFFVHQLNIAHERYSPRKSSNLVSRAYDALRFMIRPLINPLNIC
jgi:hypothetical protein